MSNMNDAQITGVIIRLVFFLRHYPEPSEGPGRLYGLDGSLSGLILLQGVSDTAVGLTGCLRYSSRVNVSDTAVGLRFVT